MNRAIVILPEFEDLQGIEKIRQKYDPLHGKLKPHVTLVFPFKSDIALTVITEHIKSKVSGVQQFELVARGLSGFQDEYIFLDIREGEESIERLSEVLYSGVLGEFYNPKQEYNPHITVGRLPSKVSYEEAISSTELPGAFVAQISKIAIVSISSAFNCNIDEEIEL